MVLRHHRPGRRAGVSSPGPCSLPHSSLLRRDARRGRRSRSTGHGRGAVLGRRGPHLRRRLRPRRLRAHRPDAASPRRPGTFFLNGVNLRTAPAAWRRILSGQAVGNHTWSHADLTHLGEAAIRAQIRRNETVHERILGRPMLKVLRPPYGAEDGRVRSHRRRSSATGGRSSGTSTRSTGDHRPPSAPSSTGPSARRRARSSSCTAAPRRRRGPCRPSSGTTRPAASSSRAWRRVLAPLTLSRRGEGPRRRSAGRGRQGLVEVRRGCRRCARCRPTGG